MDTRAGHTKKHRFLYILEGLAMVNFGIFHGCVVYSMAIWLTVCGWYHFSPFGRLYRPTKIGHSKGSFLK
jgi:hypothetical protein